MKCQIPEISWHNRDPVLSVDIQPKSKSDKTDYYRLASGGTDSHVLIWYMTHKQECGTISLDIAADLTRHQRAVNAVRWSPSGELLASGDDESVIFIWKQKGETETINIMDATNEQDKETWLTLKILRGHMEDVYDLSWSPNSLHLISGSVDNTAMIWDVHKGKSTSILQDHKGFVQGVAWDPKNQYVATLSTDRYFRVFDIATKKVLSRNNKCTLPVPKDSPLHGKTVRLFHDDTLQTFFRRLSFSPDGNLIVTPSGIAEIEGVAKPLNTTYIYTRNSLKQPAITLPSPDQYTVAVRFCPVLFQLRPHDDSKKPIIPLPYRMIFAVATKSSVYLYDTQQRTPFALISNIHYTRLTDMSWSNDGTILIVSSTDGFCSMISFATAELGEIYEDESEGKENEVTPKKTGPVRKASKDGKDEAKPIAFRKKPKPIEEEATKSEDVEMKSEETSEVQKDDEKETSEVPETKTEDKKIEAKVAKPIEIRRKPKKVEENKPPETTKVESPSKITETVEEKSDGKEDAPSIEISSKLNKKDEGIVKEIPKIVVQPPKEKIIESENIIRSDEKFESPEKKDRPVTPIAIRRHPRTPEVFGGKLQESTTPKSLHTKGATPIAFRRQPRVLAPTPVTKATAEDDAMDTWPIDQPKPVKTNVISPSECEATEDIVLVITDDEEELSAPEVTVKSPLKSEPVTPKTPRRVEFRTLSTPKSKKKLL